MAFRMLSMDFDTYGKSNSYFRILADTLVKYIVIAPGAMDAESLDDMPLNFVTILPPLPYDDSSWITAYISRDSGSGELHVSLSQEPLKGVTNLWHPVIIDFQQLVRVQSLHCSAEECKWITEETLSSQSNITMIAKTARFDWEIDYFQQETKIYSLLEGTGIAPRFLGHVHEHGRVIGFVLEKVEGRHAGIEDLHACESALKRMHALGIAHGDCNRHNFIVGTDDKVTLIDFSESTIGASKEYMQSEITTLGEQLTDESGRGGIMTFSDDKQLAEFLEQDS